MKRIDPPQTGRLAHPDEREIARQWVSLYRRAMQSPDGRVCLNPDAESEVQEWFDSGSPEPLLMALERFSQYGTFKDITEETAARERLILMVAYKFQRQTGRSHAEVVESLAEIGEVDARTIERHINYSRFKELFDWISRRGDDKL